MLIVESFIGKIKIIDDKIIVDSEVFYQFLDQDLYIIRNQKLDIYLKFHLIIGSENRYTAVIYDKEAKQSQRKIVINMVNYKLLKALYETKVDDEA